MASPFSFHCIVCFEEFDIDKRFPVVLPCGHTYICNECACRLDRCMECRTPLVEFIPRKGPPPNTNVRGRGPGSRNNGQVNAPPTPPIKKRLPLPKNVVLMSLIEATELAAETVQGREHEPSMNESPMIVGPSILDLEYDEEEKIRTGTTLAISDCGTYAVAAKDGLEIFPSSPESLISQGHEHCEEDVDTLVRFFHMDHKLDLDDDDGGAATTRPPLVSSASQDDTIQEDKKVDDVPPRKEAPPGRLSWGDRVQIVSTRNGWAKLARGYGYVRAGAHQLVKVGGSVDRSCKLEAMLRMLSSRRRELREEQKRIDNQFIALMNELQVSLMADEDLTVIAADTFHTNLENDPSASSLRVRDSAELRQPELQQPELQTNTAYEDHTPLKPRFMERPRTPPGDSSRGMFFCSGSEVLNAVLPLSSTRTQPPALPNAARSPAIAQEFNYAQSVDSRHPPQQSHHQQYMSSGSNLSSDNVENTPTRILTSAPNPSPSALRAGARAWREMHGRPPSDGIDFRTGMSGHSALFSSSAQSHDYLAQTQRLFDGMSNHTGLTMWKAKKPPSIPSTMSMETQSLD